MKRRNIVLAVIAMVLVLGMSVGTAWSYFTDTTYAEGSVTLSVEPTTTITEENGPGTKTIRIQNTSQLVPVWVRARVYAAKELGANAQGTNWSGQIEDWYEYGVPVDPSAQTEPLNVTFTLKRAYDAAQNRDGAHDGDEQNIVVIYECVPVSYDASGNALPANWN